MSGKKLHSFFLVLAFCFIPSVQGAVLYVDDDAPAGGNGSSWETAYQYLQDALAAAVSGDEIRVAQGTYKPDQGAGQTAGNRQATFQLKNGISLVGSFAGLSEPNPDLRDIKSFETILSGDLLQNDGPDFQNFTDNCYSVIYCLSDSTNIINGFIIQGGNSDGKQGWADSRGGGIYDDAIVVNCIIRCNKASYGGGIYGANPILINCIFFNNIATVRGGAIYSNYSTEGDMKVINTLFYGNQASYGGAVCIDGGNPVFVNCTIAGNSGYNLGGIYNIYYSHAIYSNCIFWGNKSEFYINPFDQDAQIVGEAITLNHCCVQGWRGDLNGQGNMGENPMFFDSDGEDDIPGTLDDNYRLLPISPCIDAGDNESAPQDLYDLDGDTLFDELIPIDLDGDVRFVDMPNIPDSGSSGSTGLPVIDIGAFESPKLGFQLSSWDISVDEGDMTVFSICLTMDPGKAIQASVYHESGDPDLSIVSGSSLVFDSSNYWIPQGVTIAAAEDSDYLNGEAVFRVHAEDIYDTDITVREIDNEVQTVMYVDVHASGLGNGSTWDNAFPGLRQALDFLIYAPSVKEIYVAEGIYRPAGPNGDRESTFNLPKGICLYGGFPTGGCSLDQCKPLKYRTILSGDLNGDDGPLFVNNDENSYHVIMCYNVDSSLQIDGFIICGGNANSNVSNEHTQDGGGIYIENGSPIFSNCIIQNNSAGDMGAGVGGLKSNPKFINCCFLDNTVSERGGGAFLIYCNTSFEDCVFRNNSSHYYYGGASGLGIISGQVVLKNCVFDKNQSEGGSGGLGVDNGDVTIENCIFTRNSAFGGGGGAGISGDACNFTAKNCLFDGNYLTHNGSGGGLSVAGIVIFNLENCIFTRNSSTAGAGISCGHGIPGTTKIKNCVFHKNSASSYGGAINFENSNPVIDNSIFRDNSAPNGPEIAFRQTSWPAGPFTLTVSHCDVEGGQSSIYTTAGCSVVWGDGNIDVDPGFTADYHLRKGSACINAGDPAYAAGNDVDMDGEPRVHSGRIDIGTDEWIDSDDDGLADWYESRFYDSAVAALPDSDDDTDGKINLEEYYRSTNPVGPYFVSTEGKYEWDGLAASWDGLHGPKYFIQSAINVANSGDQIHVSPGTYMERIDLGGKDLILRSNQPESASCIESTIIEADRSGAAVKFSGEETEACVIDGFTIMGGGNNFVGGGVDGNYTSPTHATIRRCVVKSNEADWCGGIGGCDGLIEACQILENHAIYGGGGLGVCDGIIRNCVIAHNTAADSGGGMQGCDATVQLCTIADNMIVNGAEGTKKGGAMYYCKKANIQNFILWGNSSPQLQDVASPTYSCVQGGTPGLGNLDLNPLFADPANSDYHLKSTAGRWDTASQSWVLDGETSPCIDAGNPGTPLGVEPADENNVRVNLGAFGGTAEASKTPAGWSLLTDITNDGTVDEKDLQVVRTQWLQRGPEASADFNRDGKVNNLDLLRLRMQWLMTTVWK